MKVLKRYVKREGLPKLGKSKDSKIKYNHAYYLRVTRRRKK